MYGDIYTLYGDVYVMYGDMYILYGDIYILYGDVYVMYCDVYILYGDIYILQSPTRQPAHTSAASCLFTGHSAGQGGCRHDRDRDGNPNP